MLSEDLKRILPSLRSRVAAGLTVPIACAVYWLTGRLLRLLITSGYDWLLTAMQIAAGALVLIGGAALTWWWHRKHQKDDVSFWEQ